MRIPVEIIEPYQVVVKDSHKLLELPLNGESFNEIKVIDSLGRLFP